MAVQEAGGARAKEGLLSSEVMTPLGPMVAMAEARGLVMLEFLDRPALAGEVEELRGRYGYVITPGHE